MHLVPSTALLLSLVAVAPALGQGEREPAAARWLGELRAVDELLRQGDPQTALERSRELLGELVQIKGGEGASELLGAALAQLALAEAGTGSEEPALWHLRLAEAFAPAFATADFADFGDVGRRLVAARQAAGDGEGVPGFEARPDVSPPRILESPHIVVRGSAEALSTLDPDLTVTVVVGADGAVRHPRVDGGLDNPGPVLLSLLLLRDWRFEPARRDGRPVPSAVTVGLPLTEAVVAGNRWGLEIAGIAWLAGNGREGDARARLDGLDVELANAPAGRARDAAMASARRLRAELRQ